MCELYMFSHSIKLYSHILSTPGLYFRKVGNKSDLPILFLRVKYNISEINVAIQHTIVLFCFCYVAGHLQHNKNKITTKSFKQSVKINTSMENAPLPK